MKRILMTFACVGLMLGAMAQDEEAEQKESNLKRLFTGGSISLAFGSNSFLVGGSPVFCYSLADWVDAGIVVNYNYTSYRDISYWDSNDKLRQSVYGGGGFVKLFPVRFLFVQAQLEHNFIKQKYIPSGGGNSETQKHEATSFLVGGGYTTNRYPGSGQPFFYLAVLFDIADNEYSPYTDGLGRILPIVRAGVQVPLFQRRNRD